MGEVARSLPGIIAIHSDDRASTSCAMQPRTLHFALSLFILHYSMFLWFSFRISYAHIFSLPWSLSHIFHFFFFMSLNHDFKNISRSFYLLEGYFSFWGSHLLFVRCVDVLLLLFLRHPETCIRQRVKRFYIRLRVSLSHSFEHVSVRYIWTFK